jgi:hypothetical protein
MVQFHSPLSSAFYTTSLAKFQLSSFLICFSFFLNLDSKTHSHGFPSTSLVVLNPLLIYQFFSQFHKIEFLSHSLFDVIQP